MKKLVVFIGLCILSSGWFVFNISAQNPPSSFVVFEEFVEPADVAAFTAVQQQAVDLWKKHSFEVPILSYGTEDYTFYWVIPIENFGSIDGIFQKSSAISKKMKEEDGFDGDKAFRELSTIRSSVIMWSPELSYHPDGYNGQTPDKPYCEWSFCSLKQGHEKEAAEALKKWIEFYKTSGEKYEWDVFHVVFGHDTPMLILMTRSKDPLTIRQQEAVLWEKHSKEFGELWKEFATHIRKIENKTGWFKSEWSIIRAQ